MLGTSVTDLEVTKARRRRDHASRPTEPGLQHRISSAVSAAIETVRRRVDAMGTTEPNIVRQGSARILVQVPGLQDTAQLKELIGKTARLSFHEVHPAMSAEEARQTRAPAGYKVYESDDQRGGRPAPATRRRWCAATSWSTPSPAFDQRTNEPIITFRFNNSGARKFGNFTKDHVNRPFAIVLDDKVISAPVIREPILGGSGQISGSFTVETANTAGHPAALRRAAGQAHHRRGAHRRPLARRRLHRGRQARRHHRRHRHHRPDDPRLRHLRHLRLHRPHRARPADRRPDDAWPARR